MPNIVVHNGEIAEFDLTDYYGGKDIQFNIISQTSAISLESSYPLIASKCLPITASALAFDRSALIYSTSFGKTYLMFVGSDYTFRAFDISYRYEGDIRLSFEKAIPHVYSDSYKEC